MRRTALIVVAGLLGLAGCGGSSDKPAATPAATATATATAAAPGAKSRTVPISGFEFHPAELVVATGTKVTWVDKDSANHTVSFKSGPGDLGNLDQGQKRSTRFGTAGTFHYVCQYHPNMVGTVVVR